MNDKVLCPTKHNIRSAFITLHQQKPLTCANLGAWLKINSLICYQNNKKPSVSRTFSNDLISTPVPVRPRWNLLIHLPSIFLCSNWKASSASAKGNEKPEVLEQISTSTFHYFSPETCLGNIPLLLNLQAYAYFRTLCSVPLPDHSATFPPSALSDFCFCLLFLAKFMPVFPEFLLMDTQIVEPSPFNPSCGNYPWPNLCFPAWKRLSLVVARVLFSSTFHTCSWFKLLVQSEGMGYWTAG